MPQLPQFNSGRNIEARPIAPMRDEAAFPFQLTQQIAGVMGEINQKLMQARDVMEYTEAKAKYEVATADIQARAAQDPDFKNSGVYLKELQEAKKNSLIGVKNKEMANRAALEFDYGGQIAAIKINAGFHQKQMEYNKNSLSTGVNTLMQKSMAASTPAERANTQMAIDELIQLNVTNGTITDFEAQALVYEAKKNVAMFDAQYNPERFLANRKEYGLNTSDMASIGSMAEKAKNAQEKDMEALQKKEQEQNVVNFTQAFLRGELPNISINDIQKRIDTGQLPVDFGNAFINAITTPKLTKDEIAEDQLLTVINEYLGAENERGVINVLTEALKKTGKTRQTELNAVMQFATENMQEEKRNILQKAMQGIMKIYEYSPEAMAIKSVMNFIKNINDGDEPMKAKQKAEFSTAIDTNQSLMNLSDNGTIMQDPVTGVRKRVFKDGRIEDVK